MITSMSNARVKQIVQLVQRAKVRNERNLFVVEGLKMFLEAPKERIREVYISESFYCKYENRDIFAAYAYEVVKDAVFVRMTDTQHPQGVICVVEQCHYTVEELLDGENPLLILAENLQDPGNLGTMIRTGEGAGITGVLLTQGSVDLYNPKTIRSTMGSIYRMKCIYIEDIREVITMLQEKGIIVYAAHLKGKSYYTETNYTSACAFVIGNEGKGLREETVQCADAYIRIPMSGEVESLNAAMAAGLLMYEAKRQREREGY